jgi:hypothetical protein
MRLGSNTPSLRYGNYTFFGPFGFAKTSLEDWMVRTFRETLKLNKLNVSSPLAFRIGITLLKNKND